MSDLFVTLVEKILRFGGPISERNPFHGGFIFFSVASLDLEHFELDAYSIDRPPSASVHLCLCPCYLTRFTSAFYQNKERSTREPKLQKHLWDEDMFSQVLCVYRKTWGITKNEIIRLGNYPVSYLENNDTYELAEPDSITLEY